MGVLGLNRLWKEKQKISDKILCTNDKDKKFLIKPINTYSAQQSWFNSTEVFFSLISVSCVILRADL